MSWHELMLWRWLAKLVGGDVKKIDELGSREERKVYLTNLLKKDQGEDKAADKAVVERVDSWLRGYDQRFAHLRKLETDLNSVVCKGAACLRTIDYAISETNDAQLAEMLDTLSDNKGISVISTLSTSEANDAAKKARVAAENYVQAIQVLKGEIESVSTNMGGVDDTLDLVVDVVFDFGFDFLSVLNMFALSNLSSDLGKLRSQVASLHNKLEGEYKVLESELNLIVCRARNICNERLSLRRR